MNARFGTGDLAHDGTLGVWVEQRGWLSQQHPDDALKPPDRVAKHYEDGETVHLGVN
ncbi:MAG TPA: hypothetical protein VNU92_07920 [Edaphobacter sp.]|nr:hypothetical protein [Edaphobacter sp.]